MTRPTQVFSDIVRTRYAVRGFSSEALAPEDIRGVLEDAQAAPSNSNTQPWTVHVVSGSKRDQLSDKLIEAEDQGRQTLDFSFDYGDFDDFSGGAYVKRSQHHAATLQGALGLERSDEAGRRELSRDNLRFYGAPHVAFLFIPGFGDGARAAGDLGMFAQTFLLSLTARGLGGIPQTILGFYADTVREFLGIEPELKLLFGISFGRPDEKAPGNSFRMSRAELDESFVLHDTPGVLDLHH